MTEEITKERMRGIIDWLKSKEVKWGFHIEDGDIVLDVRIPPELNNEFFSYLEEEL